MVTKISVRTTALKGMYFPLQCFLKSPSSVPCYQSKNKVEAGQAGVQSHIVRTDMACPTRNR